jgi:hypothetical protein
MAKSDYGSEDQMSAGSADDLGSDFGEMEAEYEVDDNGNPINAKGTVSLSKEAKSKPKSKEVEQ